MGVNVIRLTACVHLILVIILAKEAFMPIYIAHFRPWKATMRISSKVKANFGK